jgi:uncharacterized membrane protein YhaH (DUF805 family)
MGVLQALFSFDGRLRRRDWWLWTIALVVTHSILLEIGMRVLGGTSLPFTMGAGGPAFNQDRWMLQNFQVQSVVSLLLAWPMLAVGFKRLHDRGHSGRALLVFWLLTVIEPALTEAGRLTSDGTSGLLRLSALILLLVEIFMGLWLLLELGVLDGTRLPNRFGPSPKSPEVPTEEAALSSAALAD